MFEKCLLKYGEHRGSEFIHGRDRCLMRNQVSEMVGVDTDAEYLNPQPLNLTDTGLSGCFAIGFTIRNEQDELSVFRLGDELFRYPPQSLGQWRRAMRAYVELVRDSLSMPNQRTDRDVVDVLFYGWECCDCYIDPSHGRQC